MKLFREEDILETGSISSISFDKSTRSNSKTTSLSYPLEGKVIRLKSTSKNYIFPMIYFFTSTLFLSILLFVNLYKEHETKKHFENFPMHPFPSFSSFKKIYKNIFSASIILISISGILNIWFFCSLLLQRFSVPELKSNKLSVHLMFILGILANLIYLFFGFSPEILRFEHTKIKILRISISMIIFLSFVFFNVLFATLTLNVLMNFKKQIAFNDKRLKRNIVGKKYLVYITLFLLVLYIFAIFMRYNMAIQMNKINKNNKTSKMKYHETTKKDEFSSNFEKENHNLKNIDIKDNKIDKKLNEEVNGSEDYHSNNFTENQKKLIDFLKKIVDTILFLFPYLLFFFNSLINLSYYFDIVYLEDIINMIIDREFFLANDESTNLLSDLPY